MPPSTTAPTDGLDPVPNPPPTATVRPPGSGPLGVETTCDGIDDDDNGVTDDVDRGGDGVCDCLRLATLGLHGAWGEGDVLSGWFTDRIDGDVDSLDGEPLTPARLAPYHVLLVRDVSSKNNPELTFSAAEADALWGWVRDGGGVMTVIGYSDSTEVINVNRLLEPFSLSYGTEAIVPGGGSATAISEWFAHPLSVGITQVAGDNGYPATGQGTTIAAQDGYDLGKAAVIGDGHVLVWGDEWITYETEWANSTQYQVGRFWENALRWLTRATECQVPPSE